MRHPTFVLGAWGLVLGLAACSSACGSGSSRARGGHATAPELSATRHVEASRCGPASDEPPDPATAGGTDVPEPQTPPGPVTPGTAPAPAGRGYDPRPFVPRIDAATKARLRRVLAEGARAGLRPDVFSKIGDSISESWSFGHDLGMGWVEWGRWESLAPTLERFRRVTLGRDGSDVLNSFSVQSLCATAGWESLDAVTPSPQRGGRTPLVAEVERTRGAFAIVMYGTNDLERRTDEVFAQNLRRVVDELARRHVIVVLSTIPPRHDDPARGALVPVFNARIQAVARATGAPLVDFHGALAGLPGQGMDSDGVHPSVFHGDAASHFTEEALRHGYNVRNLLWLLTLEKLHRVVVADGAAD